MKIKHRLIVMNFLQFAVWGSYLTSMGSYLASVGLASNIGFFYAMQGVVSLFMPALMGMVADRWVAAQRLLGGCHLLAAAFIGVAGAYAPLMAEGGAVWPFFVAYSLSVAFYMPTIALSYSVAYTALEGCGEDTVRSFPPIRVWGTVGFIVAMLVCDFASWQSSNMQFLLSAVTGVVLGLYSFTLPECPTAEKGSLKGLSEALGLRAFTLFRERRMALFFIFSMLLGVSLQITNGFANPFITSFGSVVEYATSFGANHANALISLSQLSETLCILLIPFALKHFGIKRVMLIAMLAWVLRFALFGLGNPGGGVWMFILSMVVYGIAFDFFNISGSLYVNEQTDERLRSSAQGLFMMMANGVGATIGTLGAQAVVNHFVYSQESGVAQIEGWQTAWLIFAAYALVVAVAFALLFKDRYARSGD